VEERARAEAEAAALKFREQAVKLQEEERRRREAEDRNRDLLDELARAEQEKVALLRQLEEERAVRRFLCVCD